MIRKHDNAYNTLCRIFQMQKRGYHFASMTSWIFYGADDNLKRNFLLFFVVVVVL